MRIRVSGVIFSLYVICKMASASSQAQSLYTVPSGVETRWASPENPRGEKGAGAQTNGGRKGRPSISIKAGTGHTRGGSRLERHRPADMGHIQ
jgi:hypothetical protein